MNFLRNRQTYGFTFCYYVLHSNLVGLLESLKESYQRVGIPEPSDLYEVATGYACDGCYEPMFAGRSEFKFAYVIMPKVHRMLPYDSFICTCTYAYIFIIVYINHTGRA